MNMIIPVIPKSTKTADEFNRRILNLSFTLLRNKEPKLAFLIRNILLTPAVMKSENIPDNKNADIFKVNFNSFQVAAIVENLHALVNESRKLNLGKNTSIFRPGLIKSVLNEWLNLEILMYSKFKKRFIINNTFTS